MKKIILSGDEHLIEAARKRARQEHTTLDAAFREWLSEYASHTQRISEFDVAVALVCGKLKVGKKPSREEMNAR